MRCEYFFVQIKCSDYWKIICCPDMSPYYCSCKERKKFNELEIQYGDIGQSHSISETANSHVCTARSKRLRYKGAEKSCFSNRESKSIMLLYIGGIKWLIGCSEVGDHENSNSLHFTGQLAD